MTTSSASRSSRHKPRSRSHSPSHSAAHAVSSSNRSRPKKQTGRGRSSRKDSVAFYCMRCKVHSPSKVEEYVTEKWGNRQATMAKGFCRKCGGKMSLIVPASSQTHKSSSTHSSRSHSGTSRSHSSRSKHRSSRRKSSSRSHSQK